MVTRLDEILKAAGEPTRLRLLNLLRGGGVCVCDLQAVLDIPQSTVSRHLAALRHAGLVTDARDGARVVYSLAPATSPELKALFQLLDTCCPADRWLQADIERLGRAVRQGNSVLESRRKP